MAESLAEIPHYQPFESTVHLPLQEYRPQFACAVALNQSPEPAGLPQEKHMIQHPLVTIAIICPLFAVGCGSANSDNLPVHSTAPKSTVQIERSPEAEKVLSQLGQKSFVFKHRGGELTTDFTIYYRPQGKNQTEQLLCNVSGDGFTDGLPACPDDDDRRCEEGGYAMMVWPDLFPPRNGNVTFSFSLNGAGRAWSRSVKAIFPKALFDKHYQNGLEQQNAADTPVDLRPGETHTLAHYSVRLIPPDFLYPPSGSDKIPELERASELEMIRFVLTATALKEGQLSKRDTPSAK